MDTALGTSRVPAAEQNIVEVASIPPVVKVMWTGVESIATEEVMVPPGLKDGGQVVLAPTLPSQASQAPAIPVWGATPCEENGGKEDSDLLVEDVFAQLDAEKNMDVLQLNSSQYQYESKALGGAGCCVGQ